MLERVTWGDWYHLRVKFDEGGVFITDDWVVLLIGRNHLHCVSVLCNLLKLIEEVLQQHVTITLVTVLDSPLGSLYGYLAQQSKLLTAKKVAGGVALLVLGGIMGAAVNNWVWPLLFGGQSP